MTSRIRPAPSWSPLVRRCGLVGVGRGHAVHGLKYSPTSARGAGPSGGSKRRRAGYHASHICLALRRTPRIRSAAVPQGPEAGGAAQPAGTPPPIRTSLERQRLAIAAVARTRRRRDPGRQPGVPSPTAIGETPRVVEAAAAVLGYLDHALRARGRRRPVLFAPRLPVIFVASFVSGFQICLRRAPYFLL